MTDEKTEMDIVSASIFGDGQRCGLCRIRQEFGTGKLKIRIGVKQYCICENCWNLLKLDFESIDVNGLDDYYEGFLEALKEIRDKLSLEEGVEEE